MFQLLNYSKYIFIYINILLLLSCENNSIPKPKGYPRLEYENHTYLKYNLNCPFVFEYSNQAQLKIKRDSCWININYPKMRGSIYLTYYSIDNNLVDQIKQTQKMVYEHSIKASTISPKIFTNTKHKTYGTLYKLDGEVATNYQFYITDSLDHFLAGSIYFRTQPKPDSLQPALNYIEKDVVHLIETLQWK